ncbi:MAG: hypothetical protein HY862_21890 [Chloroflexi bacterium]|nr:hypothetical protein [Chloroflexota bacterium]
MGLRIVCPVCRNRMTINLQSGLVYCKACGYQPMREWQNLPPAEARIQLHPLTLKGPTKAKGEMIECPNCGGDELEPVPGKAMICCTTCGKKYPIKTRKSKASDKTPHAEKSLRGVLMERYGKAVQWDVTGRIMDCTSCGAQSIVPPEDLNEHCPFCNSQFVIVHDDDGTLDAPTKIIPFKITAPKARLLVDEKINSGLLHNISRHLQDKIVRVTGSPMFLPFWVFEVTTEVRWRYPQGLASPGMESIVHTSDPIYAAIANQDVIPQLLPYDLAELHDYDPAYLAGIRAHLYQIDMVQAATPIVKQAVEHAKNEVKNKRPRSISVYGATTDQFPKRAYLNIETYVPRVAYEFMLLPIWILLLHESDDDIRRALVNGQTGEVYVDGFSLWGKSNQ